MDLKWSNVPGVKPSSLSESDDTLPSLQALSDLHYLFGGFMDYLLGLREFRQSPNLIWTSIQVSPQYFSDNLVNEARSRSLTCLVLVLFTLSIQFGWFCRVSCLLGDNPKHSALTARISGCEMTIMIRDDGYQHSMS
ncbi:hypothetical protein Tco_1503489 [Tanacetum coccineum]